MMIDGLVGEVVVVPAHEIGHGRLEGTQERGEWVALHGIRTIGSGKREGPCRDETRDRHASRMCGRMQRLNRFRQIGQ
jgi:hypothetical protein